MRNEYGDIFAKDSFVAFKIIAIVIYLIPIRWFPRWKFLLCAFLHKVVHFWLLLSMSSSPNGSSYHYKSMVEGEIVASRPTWCMCHYNKDKGVHHLWLVPFHLSSKIDNVGLSGMTILCFSLCFYEYAVLAVLCHLFLSKHNKVILHMLIVYFCFWTFVTFRQRLSLIRKQKQKQRRLITEGNGLPLTLEFRHAFCLV